MLGRFSLKVCAGIEEKEYSKCLRFLNLFGCIRMVNSRGGAETGFSV